MAPSPAAQRLHTKLPPSSRADRATSHAERESAVSGTSHPLTVVVVSYNVAALLRRCLASAYEAFRTAGVEPHVVIVDNASTDGSPDQVQREFPDAVLLANEGNAGFGAGCNQGLALAGEAVLLLNPDTELAPDAIQVMLARLAATDRIAIVGPALRFPSGEPQPSRRQFPTPLILALESTPVQWRFTTLPVLRRYLCADLPDTAGPVDWLSGACLLGRASVLREVGGFDPDFFMYFEEVDLCRRLAARGLQAWYEPGAVVVHHHSQSADQNLSARDRNYLRSKARYAQRYFGATTARAIMATSAALFLAEASVQMARRDRRLARRQLRMAQLALGSM